MLRRCAPWALVAPSRSFSTSCSLARRQRRSAVPGREEAPQPQEPPKNNDEMPGPNGKRMQLDDLYKMMQKLQDAGAEPLADVDLGSLFNKSDPRSGPAMGDGTLRPRESELPNHLDPKDPLGLKGKRPGLFDNNMDPIFDFYEQEVGDETGATRRRISHAQIAADKKTGEELSAKIAKLERELRESKRDDPLLRIEETLKAVARDERLTEPIKLLGDADPHEINAAMNELRIYLPEGLHKMALRGDEEQSKAALNAAQRVLHLNNIMRHAYLATDEAKRPAIRAALWKAYKAAKMSVPGMLPEIPPGAWDMLFYTQAVRWNKRREQNMAELLQDMRAVGMDGPPTPPPDGKALELGAVAPSRGGRRKRPGRRGT